MDNKYFQAVRIFGFIIVLLVVNSCSTEKNTAVTRTYHNITAYYNVYYNGLDAYKTGVKKVADTHVDNYSLLLPIYFFSDNEAARVAYGDMNKAIEKGSKCVRKHSITEAPKRKEGKRGDEKYQKFYNQPEFVKWIDDAYMLIGKAHFYKRDYYPAIETFNYVIKEYSNWPIKNEAYLWLARCYAEMEKYEQADDYLTTIESEKKNLESDLIGPLNLTRAYILLKQNVYEEAIPFLKKGVENTTKKKERTRYMYILAQLYQKNGQIKKAYDLYGEVVDNNPPYEMIFNARINRASIFNASAQDSKPLQKELYKMLKDDKNLDFQDQIYYALGNIAYNESRDKDALDFYLQSAKVSTKNTNQKAVSFLAAADLYFERPDYRNSQIYYDSAVTFLSKDYPDYTLIKRKSENLNVLVQNIQIIERQDSLQRVAAMSEDDRNVFIDKLIADIVEQERLRKEEEAQRKQDMMYMQNQNRVNQQNQSGQWYFYNPSMLSMGQAEFKTKWGERKLEDNWRRKNKQSVYGDAFADNTNAEADSAKAIYSNTSREYYMVDLPLTDSALQVSKTKVEEAYFNIATIYKERFGDFDKSAESYLNLLSEYPETEFRLSTYYNLYKIYMLDKNYEQAEIYKQKIITEFPDSENAKVLNNPNYFKELEKIDNQVKFMYQATYKYFISDNCSEVNYNYQYVDSAFPESKLLPKFALLSTLCVGHLGDSTLFKDSLNRFVASYPNTEEAQYAKDVLAALDREKREVVLEKQEEQFGGELANMENVDSVDISMYHYNPKAEHYYFAIVSTEKANANRLKFNLVNFNLDYYDYLNFEVESELLSAEYAVVMVKKFKNQRMAKNYIESIKIDGQVYQETDDDAYREYMLSAESYKLFMEDKNILRLQKFYNVNYLNK